MEPNSNKLIIPPDIIVPKIKEGIFSDKKITLFYGWRDGGKSTSIAKILILKCLFDKHFRWAHVRSHYNELQMSTFKNLCDRIEEMHLQKYFTILKQHFQIVNKLRPSNYLFGAGSDNPDKIRSTQDLSGVWFEEFHDASEADFVSIYGTVREKIGYNTKFIASFNNDKVSEDSFIAKNFFDPENLIYNDVERILISHEDNQFIDQAQTFKKHMMITFGDLIKYNSLKNGEFVTERGGGWIYVSYAHLILDTFIASISGNTIYLSFDFNNEPMTCTAWQFSSGRHPMDGFGHFIRAVAEFEVSMAETEEEVVGLMCKKIKAAYPYNPLRVTGDSSGNVRLKGVQGNKSVYFLIAKHLGINPKMLDVPTSNMLLPTSRRLLNTIFFNHKNIQISKVNTPKLCADIAKAKADPDKPDHLLKNREGFKMDYMDNFRYFFHTYFSYFIVE